MTNLNNIVKISDNMSRTKSTQPSEKHLQILRTIVRMGQQGRAPAIAELAKERGLAGVSSIMLTLKVIERLGLVEYDGGGQRGKRILLKVTAAGRTAIGQLGIPLLGEIPAGCLGETIEHSENQFALPSLVPYQEGDFLLSVKGESMIGDGILSGDMVLLRPGVEVRQGEIAAVHVGADYLATLKHVFLDAEQQLVTLRASNPKFDDIVVKSNEVRIAAVYRGLIRNPSFCTGSNNYGV